MPFTGSGIGQIEAELWGLQDSAENAAAEWTALAQYAAQAGGPQDGVFGQLGSVKTELDASGGPRGWLPGLLVAILGLIFGSVGWLSQGLDNWLQWAKSNAADGFNDFLEGMRALLEAGPRVAMMAVQGAVAYSQYLYNLAYSHADAVGQAAGDAAQGLFQQSIQHADAGDSAVVSYAQALYNQSVTHADTGDAALQGEIARLQQQEQADTGNLKTLIDQNYFTLQQQEQHDTQNLQQQISGGVQPQIDALTSLIALQVLPELQTLTQTATSTASQLAQDEAQCIDPLCTNLGKTSNATGLLQDAGILALVLAFIAACMSDPQGVSDFLGSSIAPIAVGTTQSTTGVA